MSKATIEQLYACFASLDARGMAACYADDAFFDDEAFSLRGRHAIGGMWSMLTDAIRKQGRKDWKTYLERAGIPATGVSIRWHLSFRYGVFCDTAKLRA